MNKQEYNGINFKELESEMGKAASLLKSISGKLDQLGMQPLMSHGSEVLEMMIEALDEKMLDAALDHNQPHRNRTTWHAVHISDLPAWFNDPVAFVASKFSVEKKIVLDWASYDIPQTPCGHPGCRNTTSIHFDGRHQDGEENIPAYLESIKTAQKTLWYCPSHRQSAWDRSKSLGDEILRSLVAISKSDELSVTAAGLGKNEATFLLGTGLVEVRTEPRGGQTARFLRISESGKSYLQETRSP